MKLIEIQTFALKNNAFETVVCEMSAILSRPQCVKVAIPHIYGTGMWPTHSLEMY